MVELNFLEAPFEVPFFNKVMDRTALKQLITRFINQFGMTYTSHILDQLKTSGFQQATDAAISLGIDDLLTAPSKGWLVQDSEQQDFVSEKHNDCGNVHAVEKLRQLIEIWHATSEYLRQEMSPNFQMTDPFNPVHMMSFSGARGSKSQIHQLVGMRGLMSDPQGQIIDLPIQSNFREGLSLTEYIISCYGARKGVVDTAIRTADAGYLTRRLVEVVQHIVVRRADCGTIQGIFVSPIQSRERMNNQIILQTQTLIGRVLADDVYINGRCIATRNQDIGIGLANQLRKLQIQPIYIRTPFTCKSIYWICQLCYGRSTTHNNLIELGEAVGIIAGQSIGEPGTQLTLRTFHTGGVFTGDIAEHVRAPFTGKIEFNENLVYPTRTRHGHPAYICHNSLYITIYSKDKVQNLTISPQSLLLVQNDQLVESEQIIAEVRARIFPFKEKVKKHIYSDIKGEMHRSTPMSKIYDNLYLILKTSHLWVLSGGMYESTVVPFSPFHKDQDQVDTQLPLAKHQSLSNSLADQVKQKSVESSFFEKKKKISSYYKTDWTISNEHRDYIYSIIICKNNNKTEKKETNRFIIPLPCDKKWGKRTIACPDFLVRIPRKYIIQKKENNIFPFFNNPEYRIENSGILEYGEMIRNDSIDENLNSLKNKLNGRLRPKIEETSASLTSVTTNRIVINIIKISLMKYPFLIMGKGENTESSNFLFHKTLDNSFSSNEKSQLFSKHQGIIRSLSNDRENNDNKKGESFVVLSTSDFFKIVLFNDSKCLNTVKKSIRKDPILKIVELSGLLGHLHSIVQRFSYSHFITYNKVLMKKGSISYNYLNTLQVPKCYFMDENQKIYEFDPCRNIISNLVNSNWCYSLSNLSGKTFPVVSPGQLIRESVCIFEDAPLPESGQIIAVDDESLVIRSAKPYLGTPGATAYGHCGELVFQGDTLITLLYERLKSDDIIQGLPKVEELLEARSTTSISKNRKKNFQKLNRHLARALGSFWGSFISVRLTMEQSQIKLVNKVQTIYRSQGVQLSDKHIEIIVRQMTSKVIIVDLENSENLEKSNFKYEMGNVFLPGELIGLSRAQRMNRALEKTINYRTILLGMTKASLNTQSFLSEASFQETARVLTKSALQGRIDWLKGLKENVILGGMIPVGTGFNHSDKLDKQSKIDLKTVNKNLFSNKVKEILSHHKVYFLSVKPKKKLILKKLKRSLKKKWKRSSNLKRQVKK
uniref:DNA-directed RNA polymerase subunit beta'' n=1 Tax=Sciadopitys verticillata TaxID=28979 RepID=G3XHJ3_SCIVE|nr:RNA polymerase b'-subunit-2 [Sciadopitys verticillata]AMO00763.1 RNA polymerase b'-subunit-2 [Sciadopitys verticillata]BAK86740.1 RNA polymerase beta subunit-2 [Sciadopitys verticillata]BAW34570.1 RNA polymerase beta subunit-2 [Sciadopitys verticillata]BCK60739.1 RNA polymerase beta subunit-2 [Sciadopitys verticillata]